MNPMFDAANHPFFFGYVPHPEPVSQPLFSFPLTDEYFGQDYSSLGSDFALGEFCRVHGMQRRSKLTFS